MEKKDHLTGGLGALVLLVPAAVFAIAADAPYAVIVPALGVILALLLPRPLARSTRTVVYALTAVAALTVLSELVLPIRRDRFFPLPGELLGPAGIYLALVLLFFRRTAPSLFGVIALSLGVMTLAGNRMLTVAPLQKLALMETVLPDFVAVYVLGVAVHLALVLFLIARLTTAGSAPGPTRFRWRRSVCVGGAVLLTAMGVVGLRWSAVLYERLATRWFGELFDSYMNRHFSAFLFDEEVDLWRTVSEESGRDRAVLLRIVAPDAPGYLRGRAYRHYVNGHWKAGTPQQELSFTEPEAHVAYLRFSRPAAAVTTSTALAPPRRGRYLPTPRLHGDVLPAPGGAQAFTVCARGLASDADGTLVPADWERDAGYDVWTTPEAVYPRPPMADEREYLAIPDPLRPLVKEVLREVVPLGTRDRDRVSQTCRWLQARCHYALGVKRDPARDPVAQFLSADRRGHCELFASAAVFLLRGQGIPARYVTGLVAVERHPSRAYWLARMSDAHAWAEAWLPDEKAWILVEATPAAGIPQGLAGQGSRLDAYLDRLAYWWQCLYSDVKRGLVASVVIDGALGLWRALLAVAMSPLRATVALSVCLAAGSLLLYAWRHRRRAAVRGVSLAHAELCRTWADVERRLARAGFRRQPHETLHEFVLGLRDGLPAAEFARLLTFVERYTEQRYRAAPPRPEALEQLRRAARQVFDGRR